MLNALWQALRNPAFESAALRRWEPLYTRLFASRWTFLFLLLVGILRALFFLAAYPPADGADAADYYLYAAYIGGFDLPTHAANVSPVYPIFIYLNTYVLGNFNLVILWQLVMSSLLGVLMYWGLRRYNALLAFLVALVVLGDAQIGVIFNFTSTEPPYIFMLVSAYALAVGTEKIPGKFLRWQDVLLGVLLILLRETRTVARYLFLPFVILFALHTRDWRRIAVLLFSLALTAVGFDVLTRTAQVAQSFSYNENMYARPLFVEGLLDAANGEASAQVATFAEVCRERPAEVSFTECMETQAGNREALNLLFRRAYEESLQANPGSLLSRSIAAFWDYLRGSGHQYSGSPTPADVQCENIPARLERQIDHFLNKEWAALELTASQQEAFITASEDFMQQMCPPGWDFPEVRSITNFISERYRSLSRPRPLLWNGALLALILLLPWARRYWLPVLLAGGIWAYHAAISAAVQNVQPRYIVVTNPLRAVLVVMLVFLVMNILLRLWDAALKKQPTTDSE